MDYRSEPILLRIALDAVYGGVVDGAGDAEPCADVG